MSSKYGDLARRLWARIAFRGVHHYADRHHQLDDYYRLADPWGMETEKEQHRFAETNCIISEQIGKVQSVIEIGCGEGFQSQQLLTICEQLIGTDVSERAVKRARQRCPTATFLVGDIFSQDFVIPGVPVDLVVACEVLYYVSDVPKALRRMSELGKTCLVTYYDGEKARLNGYLQAVEIQGRREIRYGESFWQVAWWQGNS